MLRIGSKIKIGDFLFFLVLLSPLHSEAKLNIGAGTSSFTYGRAVPSLSLAIETDSSWNLEYQSEGVQTTVYSQNAWTLAGYKTVHNIRSGVLGASIGTGLGTSYILRVYRTSTTASTEKESDYVIGPYLSTQFNIGMFFIGFNTLLGLTKDVQQHILLNYQEVSHIIIGVTL